jgi:SAM-dependent methyltransferase
MNHAYSHPDRLEARIGIYEYQKPKIDLEHEVLQAMGSIAGARILDAGCGNGRYARALMAKGADVAAMDLSRGMLHNLHGLFACLQADAEALPIANGSVDRVLAAHMLYHLPHPERALAEFARVLSPAGLAVITSNTEAHLNQARGLWKELLIEADLDTTDPDIGLLNLELPVPLLLARVHDVFRTVESQLLTSTLVLTDPEPLVRYIASTTAAITTKNLGHDLLPALHRRIADRLTMSGPLHVTTEVILVTARHPHHLR